MLSGVTTRVRVADQVPLKEYRTREYRIVSDSITKPPLLSNQDDPPTTVSSRVSVDYPEQTVVKVEVEGKSFKKEFLDMVACEIKEYLKVYR